MTLKASKNARFDGFDCHGVADRDPLAADSLLAKLPEMNRHQDVPALIQSLRSITPSLEAVRRFEPADSLAAMRDIGMYLASLKRHGLEPVEVVPKVEPVLLLLGRQTDMIPRNTVFHYGAWNPEDQRQRMFTGEPEEATLIASVRVTPPRLEAAVGALCSALEADPGTDVFLQGCLAAERYLRIMPFTMRYVLKHVTPVFFARQLRPYMEAVVIGGHTYFGPAAAYVPVYLIDNLLWCSADEHQSYLAFQWQIVPYSTPGIRRIFNSHWRETSIVHRVTAALRAEAGPEDNVLQQTADSLCGTLRTLAAFRSGHRVIANAAYAKDIRLYDKGSGGGSVDFVNSLQDLTRRVSRQFKHSTSVTSE